MPDFIPNSEIYTAPPDSLAESQPARESIRIILIGSGMGISVIINILHSLGFAEPRAWSKAQIDPANGKPMRILTKWIRC